MLYPTSRPAAGTGIHVWLKPLEPSAKLAAYKLQSLATSGPKWAATRLPVLPVSVIAGPGVRPGVGSEPIYRGQAISTFEELRYLGHLGPQGLRLIDRLLRQELKRFPDLIPSAGWQQADYEDVVQEFLVERIDAVTANVLAMATDDDSLGRLLRRSIRNWLIDWARKTPRGALRIRVVDVLQQDGAFEQVLVGHEGGGRWRLSGSQAGPWSGSLGELVEAAYAVTDVRVPVWATEKRRSPVADRASIVAILRAVLIAAQGSVEVAALVSVFARRFPASLDPVEVMTDDNDLVGLPVSDNREGMQDPQSALIRQEDQLDIAVSAAEIVGRLSVEERALVPLLDGQVSAAAVQELLGCGRSQAYLRVKRLREKLRLLIGEQPDMPSVAAEVMALCSTAKAA
ncbi:hypothetical protein ACFV3F_43290 [Streptomyces sp. NPDC059717]|uniref:hypothetical protein n=1 Tax=Streptomyces sp. NPDC059717 TaxID=3346922 RepID=UPI0036C448AD